MSWRARAIAADARKFHVLKKKLCDRSVWVQVGDKATGKGAFGCVFLSTIVTLEDYQIQCSRLLYCLPNTSDMVIVARDKCRRGVD